MVPFVAKGTHVHRFCSILEQVVMARLFNTARPIQNSPKTRFLVLILEQTKILVLLVARSMEWKAASGEQ